jgi:hypothetical protein
MILNCILLGIILYILYKMYMGEPIPYLQNVDTFSLRGISAWDGRGTDYKKCLNNIQGIREYHDASNICSSIDPFNKYL